MTEDTLDDLLLRSAHIQSAQPMLWAALALAVVAPLALLFRAEPLAIVGWLGGWLAGPAALSRVVLAFCDAHSRPGIAELREAVRRVSSDAQGALTQQLLLRRNGRWELLNEG